MTRLSLLVALALLCSIAHAEPPVVETFSPRGSVKAPRQVVARFSRPVVAFGDPHAADPFTVECPVKGSGHWTDARNWQYIFDADLPGGLSCAFSVKPALRDLAGEAFAPARFSFDTGGPAILQSEPREGATVAEDQVFILGLDAPADPVTVAASAWCDVAGLGERVGVRLVEGEDRKAILAQHRSFLFSYYDVLFKSGAEEPVRVRESGSDREAFARRMESGDARILLVACRQNLPNRSQVRLVWGKGIAAPGGGPATAQDQGVAFETRPAFEATMSCPRLREDSECIPLLPVTVHFTAPIPVAQVKGIRLAGPDGKAFAPTFTTGEGEPRDWVDTISFPGPLPQSAVFRLELPRDLKDDAGRTLANAALFPLTVKTDEYPPLAKFAAVFGILERHAEPALPVTVRNLEPEVKGRAVHIEPGAADPVPGQVLKVGGGEPERDILFWLKRVKQFQNTRYEYDKQQKQDRLAYSPGSASIFKREAPARTFSLPRAGDAKDFEVVGIPLQGAGFYVAELASPRLGASLTGVSKPYYVQAAALVTNLGVHLKYGRESSLVWVTTLDHGTPVPDAAVTVRDCTGDVLWSGRTDSAGRAPVDSELPRGDKLRSCPDMGRILVAFARTADDLGFVQSDWNEGISTWRFHLPSPEASGPEVRTTVFARTLLRAGERVDMKHFRRQRTGAGIARAGEAPASSKVVIRHAGSDQQFPQPPLAWDGAGIAVSSWQIPKDARQGEYLVDVDGTVAGAFRVEAFRLPTMRAVVTPRAAPWINVAQGQLELQLSYLAGGGAALAPVRINSVLSPRAVSFPDYENYNFANGNVAEGIVHRGPDRDWDDEVGGEPVTRPLASQALRLDKAGAARATLDRIPSSDVPRDLLSELEYRDANGETATTSTRIPLWPSGVVLGIRPDAWTASREGVQFRVVALDPSGHPQAGVAVSVDLLERSRYAHRKRLVGGFYAYDNVTEVKRLGAACSGTTDARGLLDCKAPSPVSGNVILRAQAKDRSGNASVAHADVWVAGSGDWWFETSSDDRMDLLPERPRYEPGETARLQVRMPFRTATALVTVEREGVLDSFVVALSGKEPVVEVPLKGAYAPNVYVSVLAVRGRVGDVQPTAMVDLGRPAFKLGLAHLRVGWRAHELKVTVKPDRDVFAVRERADVVIQAKRADGSALPDGAEVAVAAVDEALLELMPNGSWSLLEHMMQTRALEVESASASMQVIGRRHFGRKALAQGGGGGGGRQTARELFDPLLLWSARVKLDAQGMARMRVPLNDALSSFRIVAVASAGHDLFGTGSASIRTSQDLALMSGLPLMVREGDRFDGGFTVRNATTRALSVKLTAEVQAETPAGVRKLPPLEPITLDVAPGGAAEAVWPLKAPADARRLVWEVGAISAGSAGARPVQDHMRISQDLTAAIPVRTVQATLMQLDARVSIPVTLPPAAVAGRGGLSVDLSRSIAGQLDGAREYMRRYTYICLEQNLSRAVALHDDAMRDAVLAELPAYLDRDGLAKYFPRMDEGSDILTAYILSTADEAGWNMPDDVRARMRAGLQKFVRNQVTRGSDLPTADLALRKLAALEALSRGDQAIEARLLDTITIEPQLWPTSALLDWYLILRRTASVPDRERRLDEAAALLRARLHFSGTRLGFSTERSDALWWLMISADLNANRMVLAMLDAPDWRGDLGRLAQGALMRQSGGHWNTTAANAWGVLAMEKFARQVEAVPVSGTTTAHLGETRAAHQWKADQSHGELTMPPVAGALELQHDGNGRPWVTLTQRAAVPIIAPSNHGYRITRTVTPVEQVRADGWVRGDVLRVRLDIDAVADMTWVVVDDPIPAGSTILGTGLGRDSAIMTTGEQGAGSVWPAFEERRSDAFRAYYRYVPKGRFTVEYTMRLNTTGAFQLPQTRVEAMYAPDVFGESPNGAVQVGAAKDDDLWTRARRWLTDFVHRFWPSWGS